MKSSRRLRWLAALALLALSLMLLIWGFWPESLNAKTLALQPEDLHVPTPTPASPLAEGASGIAADLPVPALLEQRRLELEAPLRIRQGDSASIRLTLRLEPESSPTPTSTSLQSSSAVIQIANVFDTHRVIAQARLDMAGIEAVPAAGQTQLQALRPGDEITFYWSIRSREIASYSGVVWFSLRYEPLDGSPPVEQMLSAQPLEIECVNFAGLGGTPARLMGGAGILLGVLLGRDATGDFLKKYRASRKTRAKTSRKTNPSKRSTRKTRSR